MKKVPHFAVGAAVSILALNGLDTTANGATVSPQRLAVISLVQNRNSISGYVFDTERRPVEKLNVELLDEVDSVIARTRTDVSGRYSFDRISFGTFQVRVLTHGTDLVSETRRVSLGNIVGSFGSQSVQENFTLRAKNESSLSNSSPRVVFAQEIPPAAKKAYEKATQKLDKEKGGEADLSGLKEAVALFPPYYAALERLGVEYVKRQQYEDALPVLTKAVEVNPRAQMSFYSRGIALYSLKRLPDSVESLRQAVSLSPSSVNALYWLGRTLREAKQSQEAEKYLKRAEELSKNAPVPDVHWQLALLYGNQLKRYNDAANELELFLQARPDAGDGVNIRRLIAQFRAKAKGQ